MVMQKLPRMQSKNAESGFTLIELLVVILIIGVLAAIAIPAFLNQRKEAVDASLKSDLRNLAMSYETWRAKDTAHTNSAFSAAVEGKVSAWVADEEASFVDPAKTWNEVSGLDPVYASDGTYVNLVLMWMTTATWERTHEEGEYCLAAMNTGSNYDFITNTGMGAANYHRQLYYDKALGGIQTAEEIADAMISGQKASCDGQIGNYLGSTGGAADKESYWQKYSERR